ncbi:MAG: thermonuclease family protein [Ignavibacteria bacterium]|nr:thermonuclease family protein [Ignavibacteria bacterium]
MKEEFLYYYKANVVSVYDGDTITVDIDVGFNTTLRKEKIRLHRINAPEIRGRSRKKSIASRDYLRSLLDGKEILLQTIKDRKEKFGRYLGEVWLKQNEKLINVNDELVKQGFAEYKKYE